MLDLSEEMVCIKNSHSLTQFQTKHWNYVLLGAVHYIYIAVVLNIYVLTYLYKFSGKVWTLTALSRGLYGQAANKTFN